MKFTDGKLATTGRKKKKRKRKPSKVSCYRMMNYSQNMTSLLFFFLIFMCSQETHESQDNYKQKLLEDNKKEDKEIKKLEKLLRLDKKKKMPSQFSTEGLDCIFRIPLGANKWIYLETISNILLQLSKHLEDLFLSRSFVVIGINKL